MSKQMPQWVFWGRVAGSLGILVVTGVLLGFPEVSLGDSEPAFSRPGPDVLNQAKVKSRSSLDFSIREPFREEHVYTYYFPADTWQSAIAAFREKLGEREEENLQTTRLFRDLSGQIEQLDMVPPELQISVKERAAAYIDPRSEHHIHLNNLPHKRSRSSGPGYIRDLNQELLNVLVAWKMTGDDRYRAFAVEMVEALLKEFPLELFTDSTASSAGPDVDPHAAGELMQALAIAYDLLRGEMDEIRRQALAQQLSVYIEVQLERTRSSKDSWGPRRPESNWWVPYHNWTGIVSGSMGLAALAIEGDLEDFDPMPALWTAYSSLDKWIEKGFEPEGAYLEGNHYIQLGLGFALPFIEALALRGGPNLYQHPHLQGVLSYVASELLPGTPPQRLNAWNRSDYQPLRWDYFALMLSSALDQPVGLWIWEQASQALNLHPLSVLYYPVGMDAVHPKEAGLELERFFLRRGLVNLRTGWEPDDFFFSFSSGPAFPTTHGQSDENTFHLYAYGEMFAVDSGSGGYDTESKSGILINGQGQATSSGARSVDGFTRAYGNCAAYSYVMGDAKSAYDQNNRGDLGISVGRADRHVLYVKGDPHTDSLVLGASPYVIIYDDIQHNQEENEYTWLLLSAPGNTIESDLFKAANDVPVTLRSRVIGAHGKGYTDVHFLYPHEPEVESDQYQRNPCLRVTARAVNPHFLSILFPYRDQWEDELPSLYRLEADGFAAGILKGETYADFIGASVDTEIATASIHSDAQLLHVRFDKSGEIFSWMAIGASYLNIGGIKVFDQEHPISLQYHLGNFSLVEQNLEHAWE